MAKPAKLHYTNEQIFSAKPLLSTTNTRRKIEYHCPKQLRPFHWNLSAKHIPEQMNRKMGEVFSASTDTFKKRPNQIEHEPNEVTIFLRGTERESVKWNLFGSLRFKFMFLNFGRLFGSLFPHENANFCETEHKTHQFLG